MRFFKYLVFLFLFLISYQTYAATCTAYGAAGGVSGSSPLDACRNYYSQKISSDIPSTLKAITTSPTTFGCSAFEGNGFASGECTPPACPEIGTPADFHQGSNGEIPTKRCLNINGNICSFSAQGKDPFWVTLSGGSTPTRQLYSDSNQPSPSCTSLNEGQCDTTNPYGSCYKPPNDGCIRNKDGSINCPQNTTPPIKTGCENGATYCDRPPNGCGPDYVSGSFNGKQICVRKGPDSPDPNKPIVPNDTNKPDQPNACSSSYCPKPDNTKDCPNGYYETKFEGNSICVTNNPTPNQPNPNDPNNSIQPPLPVDPNNPQNSLNLNEIINSIKSLKDSLLGSIDGVSRKLTTLIQGQKTSNEHLKNIKDESIKTNEKLDTSNEHLDKIEEATQASSTAIGETNKKLDQIFTDQGKEQIEQLGEQSTDSRLTAAESEMTSKLQTFANTLSYSSSHACISDFTVTNIPHFGSMTVPLSKWCDLLALVKLLLKLAVLMLALKMIDATVRAF
ncbi:hypothetical protein [Acinetobacter junii]|uniref:hypothetical protein n=1 Tax=Acinetobacter junii TaxID=40215 RepID=UPI0032B5D04B